MVGAEVTFSLMKIWLPNRRFGWLSGLLLGLSLSLSGCSSLVTVQSVRQHPKRNWLTATVKLQGTVGSLVPLVHAQVYELQDATGQIWVLSSHHPLKPALKPGQRLLIQGLVRYEPIEIAGQNLGEVYIEEQQQLEPTP